MIVAYMENTIVVRSTTTRAMELYSSHYQSSPLALDLQYNIDNQNKTGNRDGFSLESRNIFSPTKTLLKVCVERDSCTRFRVDRGVVKVPYGC